MTLTIMDREIKSLLWSSTGDTPPREAQSDQARRDSEERAQREERMLEERARHFVVVDFQPNPVWGNLIDIVFENAGQTLAKGVRFRFTPELESSQEARGGYNFRGSVLITQGIPAMPPGKRFAALFDLSHERIKTDLPMAYTESRCRRNDQNLWMCFGKGMRKAYLPGG